MEEFELIRGQLAANKSNYIIQEAAQQSREFEVFYIRSAGNIHKPALISVTEVSNGAGERFPINGIYNKHTVYTDRTADFSTEELTELWNLLKDIGLFRLARVGITELWIAAILVKIWWPYSVIESYLEGDNYRVVVARDKILSVLQRYPAFVDGDGHAPISELIDRENAIRRQMELLPVISPIPKSQAVVGYLQKKRLCLSSVPGKGERVQLFNRITLASGGVVEILDLNSMPTVNQELFLGSPRDSFLCCWWASLFAPLSLGWPLTRGSLTGPSRVRATVIC